jgi:hypothetical protein
MGTALGWSGQQNQSLGNWNQNLAGQSGMVKTAQEAKAAQGASQGAMIGGAAGIAGAAIIAI